MKRCKVTWQFLGHDKVRRCLLPLGHEGDDHRMGPGLVCSTPHDYRWPEHDAACTPNDCVCTPIAAVAKRK